MNTKFLSSYYKNKAGWFRVLGYGLKFKHVSYPLLFSERNGYSKLIKIGNYNFGFLNKTQQYENK